jgi:hypothetical protein
MNADFTDQSRLSARLRIGSIGPFYFAWADKNEAFDPAVHARIDEDIFKFDVDHSEGDFATLTAIVRNPRIGLLAPSRWVWAWLSWQNGTDLIPLFYGRLVGVPTDINQELVTLVFTARPADFVALKAAKAETLKAPPYYDPIWINPDALDDPDTVLEARSALWSIDRVTHEVDISDVLVGEDGIEDFAPDEVPYDSVKINLGETPLRSVSIDATVNWTQQASGTLQFGLDVSTYTGQSLISDWPKPGVTLGGGWTVDAASARDLNDVDNVATSTYSVNWQNQEKKHATGDTMSISISSSVPIMRGPYLYTDLMRKFQTGFIDEGGPDSDPINIPTTQESTGLYVPLWQVKASMTLKYEGNRPRKEHARFTLVTDVQDIVTLAEDADTLAITLDSQDVGAEVAGGPPPIGYLGRRSYLPTDRGLWSLEYLIALARAHLLIRSRCVEITFACTFERAVALTCRKNAQVFDERLPGGQALGKIIDYKFSVDGSTGLAIGSVTIGCAIGYGGAIQEQPGEPTYGAEGYMVAGYQAYANREIVLPAGDVSYTPPIDAPNDDELTFPLTKRQAVVREQVHGSADAQADAIRASFPIDVEVNNAQPQNVDEQNRIAALQTQTTTEILKTNSVWYDLELKPVAGMSFETAYDIAVSELKVLKMIDLEAASA